MVLTDKQLDKINEDFRKEKMKEISIERLRLTKLIKRTEREKDKLDIDLAKLSPSIFSDISGRYFKKGTATVIKVFKREGKLLRCVEFSQKFSFAIEINKKWLGSVDELNLTADLEKEITEEEFYKHIFDSIKRFSEKENKKTSKRVKT